MNLATLLDMAADGFGARVAVGDRTRGLTYAGLRDASHRVAARLRERAASRLVLASVNDDAIPALMFGAARAGCRYSSVNYRLADDRLRSLLGLCAPALVVADATSAPRIEGIEGLEPVTAASLTAAAAGAAADADGGVAIVLFTSGTSGPPKSVLLRHENLFAYVISTTEFMSAGADEAALVSVPPYHVAGIAAVLSNVYIGRRIVYLPAFDGADWVRLAAEQAVTHAMIVPTMLARILDALEESGTRLPTLRALSYGGGRMPPAVVRRAMALLPDVAFVNAYGLTETSSTVALLTPEDHRRALAAADKPEVARRLGSVGRALPGVELAVHGVDGAALPAGEVGEIVVRGEQVSGEYESGDVRDADGWFHTRDHGWLDDEGYLFVEGRADDVIVRGGENLSPGEIEEVLLAHDAVREAAVVAVPDEEWGESPAAVVVAVDGADVDEQALQGWVRGRLRSSRTPVLVQFRDALPYSDTGKLLRRELRASLSRYGDAST